MTPFSRENNNTYKYRNGYLLITNQKQLNLFIKNVTKQINKCEILISNSEIKVNIVRKQNKCYI